MLVGVVLKRVCQAYNEQRTPAGSVWDTLTVRGPRLYYVLCSLPHLSLESSPGTNCASRKKML